MSNKIRGKHFKNSLKEIYEDNRWLWEELEGFEYAAKITNALNIKIVYAISDGSYFDSFGIPAFIIKCKDSHKIMYKSITPGPKNFQSSH